MSLAVPTSQRSEDTAWVARMHDDAMAVRRDIAQALKQTGGGHYGGSFSAVELLLTVYTRHLRDHDPARRLRDRFILSKGHGAIGLYAVLRHIGWIDTPLDTYASFGSPLEGHPDMTASPAIDWSTGSLGQGLSAALGMAMGLRAHGRHVWVMLGDGECQEGQVWEAAMLAGLLKPTNLHVIVDLNRHQEFGWHLASPDSPHIDPVPDMAAKWRSFGWETITCDGHDPVSIDTACARLANLGGPGVLLAETRKGKGTPLTESDPLRFHCTDVTDIEHAAILAGLERP